MINSFHAHSKALQKSWSKKHISGRNTVMKNKYIKNRGFLVSEYFYSKQVKEKSSLDRIVLTRKTIDNFYANIIADESDLLFLKLKHAEKIMKFSELSFKNISLPYISACISATISLIVSYTTNISSKLTDINNIFQYIGVLLAYIITIVLIVVPIGFIICLILRNIIKSSSKDYFVYILPYEIKVIRITLDRLIAEADLDTDLKFNENKG